MGRERGRLGEKQQVISIADGQKNKRRENKKLLWFYVKLKEKRTCEQKHKNSEKMYNGTGS